MLDYIVIEAVRDSVAKAKELMEGYGLSEGIIFAEVKNILKQTSLLPKFDGFEFCELTTVGATTDEDYCNCIRAGVHQNHLKVLDNKPVAPLGWGGSSLLVEQCELSFDTEPYNYSIIVGVIGGSKEQNTAVLRRAMDDIKTCQPPA